MIHDIFSATLNSHAPHLPNLTSRPSIAVVVAALIFVHASTAVSENNVAAKEPWKRHTIDASSRGADGVRVADVNGDGWPDLTTGWEEGGKIRLYLHPGGQQVKEGWPAVTVGNVKAPEDAVLVDLDGDGAMDVVSCCEGRNRTVYVHWAPKSSDLILDASAWKTQAFPATENRQSWMFAVPMQVDGRHGVDLILGSKGSNASIGWLEAPADPRDVSEWKWHAWRKAGWIMSLETHDMDMDGDLDVLASDRKGRARGVLWLENPGPKRSAAGVRWQERRIGGEDHEVMFLTRTDLDGQPPLEVVAATRNSQILVLRPHAAESSQATAWEWQTRKIANPFGIPNGKAVRVADVDLDGRADIIHTSNTGGKREAPGVAWMSRDTTEANRWTAHDVSGPRGVKFDLIQMLDLDRDGDLDVVTCEERDNLGVFWYENPTR